MDITSPTMTATSLPHKNADEPECNLQQRWLAYMLLITISAGISAAGIFISRPLQSANDRSRWCTVWSLVERGTYVIDEIDQDPAWRTIDKVRHQNHFYSTKPALLPTLVAGVYWLVKQTTGLTLSAQPVNTVHLILFLVNWLPSVLALMLFTKLVDRYATRETTKLILITFAGVGTLLLTFQTTLNNHTIAAYSMIFALYPACRIVIDKQTNNWLFGMAGLFGAFTCTNELPAALFGVALFLLLFLQDRKRTLFIFVPTALIPLAGFFLTTYLSTGGWKPFYMYYGTEKYEYVYQGIPSYWMNPTGVDANHESPIVYALHCLIGHHGIFSLSPIFLITLFAWLTLRKWRDHPLKPFLWLGLGLTVAILMFYLSRTQNYNYGGVACGLRWMFWLIPFWLITMVPLLDYWGNRRWLKIVVPLLLLPSLFSVLTPLQNPWQQPWLFSMMEQWHWIDYSQPPEPLKPTLTTWFRSLPDRSQPESKRWIEYRSIVSANREERIRLADIDQIENNGSTIRVVKLTQFTRAQQNGKWQTIKKSEIRFEIDEKMFRSGKRPSLFLVTPQADDNSQAEIALSGLPTYRTYRAGRTRYIKTVLQDAHFQCQLAAAQVLFAPESGEPNRKLRYRRDLWLCKDVPFGLLKFRITISQPDSEEILSLQDFVAVDWSE